jgi:ubiquinone/menaquinone biosynthesis C-methylase UbiE
VFPEGTHDEAARFSYLAQLNHFIQTEVFPGNRLVWETRVHPAFLAQFGREPQSRQEIAPWMQRELYYQTWGNLRRNLMEMRQENGRAVVLRQLDELIERARRLNEGSPRLKLRPGLEIPEYLTRADIHCMPGSYQAELRPDDISPAANYDAGTYVITAGLTGRYSDGGGRALAAWLRQHAPELRPRRVLDIGCGLGLNTLPLATAFPDATVHAIDVAAPMLRYAHARATSLGVTNVVWEQMNAESMDFPTASFDLVIAATFWHETSPVAFRRILREIRRVIAPNGLHLSLEQPPYRNMPAYDAFIRDWDGANNNEPFWGALHDLDCLAELADAGFDRASCFETQFEGQMEADFVRGSAMDQGKDFGRGGSWYGFGART